MSVANLAGLIFVIFIAIGRKDIKLFKKLKLNFLVITVSELVHFENQANFLVKYAKAPGVPLECA